MSNDYYLSWGDIQRDSRTLAARLTGQSWRGIIAITRGGLIPAAILARELNIRCIDTFCVVSYQHKNQAAPEALKLPSTTEDGDGFLIVDDLVDTGVTAKLARELYPLARYICLYAKPAGKPLTDDFCREFSQDTWLHFPWDSELRYVAPITGEEN